MLGILAPGALALGPGFLELFLPGVDVVKSAHIGFAPIEKDPVYVTELAFAGKGGHAQGLTDDVRRPLGKPLAQLFVFVGGKVTL